MNGLPTSQAMTAAITTAAASNVDQFQTLSLTISNPPTQAEVAALLDTLNALIQALRH